jgi:HSP20 family molecular chaperone IbpA
MTESIVEKKNDTIRENMEPVIRYKIRPKRYFNFDAEEMEWELEVHLPGVQKSEIKLRISKHIVVKFYTH